MHPRKQLIATQSPATPSDADPEAVTPCQAAQTPPTCMRKSALPTWRRLPQSPLKARPLGVYLMRGSLVPVSQASRKPPMRFCRNASSGKNLRGVGVGGGKSGAGLRRVQRRGAAENVGGACGGGTGCWRSGMQGAGVRASGLPATCHYLARTVQRHERWVLCLGCDRKHHSPPSWHGIEVAGAPGQHGDAAPGVGVPVVVVPHQGPALGLPVRVVQVQRLQGRPGSSGSADAAT